MKTILYSIPPCYKPTECTLLVDSYVPIFPEKTQFLGGRKEYLDPILTKIRLLFSTKDDKLKFIIFRNSAIAQADDYFFTKLSVFGRDADYLCRIYGEIEDDFISNSIMINIEIITDWKYADDVIDTTKPIISLNGQSEITIQTNGTYTELGATATDNKDGDITSKIVISGTVDTSTNGDYIISYDVTDSSGNVADTVTRKVIVSDYIDTNPFNDNSLIHYYKFENNLIDSVGNEDAILINGNSSYTEKGINGDNNITILETFKLIASVDFSITFYAKGNMSTGTDKNDVAWASILMDRTDVANEYNLELRKESGGNTILADTFSYTIPSDFYHVSIVKTSGNIKIYFNNILKYEGTFPDNLYDNDQTLKFFNDSQDQNYPSEIAELARVGNFNRAITSTEIQKLIDNDGVM